MCFSEGGSYSVAFVMIAASYYLCKRGYHPKTYLSLAFFSIME